LFIGLPYVVIELKNNSSSEEMRDAMVQLLSYGFSVQHHKRFTSRLTLLILSPNLWWTLVLPPYSESGISEEYFKFDVLQPPKEKDGNKLNTVINRKQLLSILMQYLKRLENTFYMTFVIFILVLI
jgi:hypothetical protein